MENIQFNGTEEEWDSLVNKNKEQQKELLKEIMEADARDGLYQDISKMETTQTDHIGDTNKMVTAVEWLIDNWIKFNDIDIELDDFANLRPLLEQAKQMEKEQIIEAYKFGIQDEYVIGSEKYYNKTYKK